nr:MAG TPA: hypothetical protein [Inoviridae sp.]
MVSEQFQIYPFLFLVCPSRNNSQTRGYLHSRSSLLGYQFDYRGGSVSVGCFLLQLSNREFTPVA